MGTEPAYRQIEAWLRDLLPDKSEGDLLPTIANICQRFGVSGVQTVRDAYQPLIEEGWIRVQQRPQRRWVVAKVPPRASQQMAPPTAALTRLARIEEALRGALRDLEALKGEIERQ
ncbi:GntR family transcriptional regulator [Actinocrispum wychmicini]|uniref:Regulatory GntR family protein n=1 Tax=Actinocrispum wychmicini TaxID=1213861 RepID=A0A4R2JBA3_9PSEU|nr:GntR family transcriptional regulator [Actinocrispum wychmicini]TCO55647.1 regulatory GntR family protein [Actinocrispum wychmicini]